MFIINMSDLPRLEAVGRLSLGHVRRVLQLGDALFTAAFAELDTGGRTNVRAVV
jgi:hypothetical protein